MALKIIKHDIKDNKSIPQNKEILERLNLNYFKCLKYFGLDKYHNKS